MGCGLLGKVNVSYNVHLNKFYCPLTASSYADIATLKMYFIPVFVNTGIIITIVGFHAVLFPKYEYRYVQGCRKFGSNAQL